MNNETKRIIKFRAWDGKKMWFDICVLFGKQWDLLNDRAIEGYPIMQFTGLMDKSGVDIYESDILKDSEGYLYEVSWQTELGSFCVHREGWMYKHWFGEGIDPKDIEVAGNIHEGVKL